MKVPVPVKGSIMWTPFEPRVWPNSFLQNLIHRMDNEIHNLNGGVDDAEFFGGAGEGFAEKFIIKLDDQLLLSMGIGDALGAHLHACVEFFRGLWIPCRGWPRSTHPEHVAWRVKRGSHL